MTEPIYPKDAQLVLREEKTASLDPKKKRLVLRDMKTGRIVKSTKRGATIAVQDVMRAVAERIMTPDESGESDYDKIITAMVDLATTGRGKESSAACKAASWVREAAFGMAAKSEVDRSAEAAPVKIVLIGVPEEMVNKQITEEKPKPALRPSFIDAEIIENPALTALVKVVPQAPKPASAPDKKGLFSVGQLANDCRNAQAMERACEGKTIAYCQSAAEKEPPLRVDTQNVVKAGILRLAVAFMNHQEVIEAEVVDV
jgi:hypothetical protein